MPRSGSGIYTLPALNPVVVGTTIEEDWGNNTMDDIATALTGSLSRSGDGAMLAPLKLIAGTAGAPGLTWSAETTMGLYRVGTAEMAFSVGSAKRLSIAATVTYAPDAGSTFYELGFRRLPFRTLSAAGSLAASDSGKGVTYDGPGSETLTVENLVALDVVVIQNEGSGALTIAEALSGTMIWLDGTGVLSKVGSRTLAVGGVATIRMTDANNARIWGIGLT